MKLTQNHEQPLATFSDVKVGALFQLPADTGNLAVKMTANSACWLNQQTGGWAVGLWSCAPTEEVHHVILTEVQYQIKVR